VPLVFTYHTQLEAYAHYVPFEGNVTRGAATHLTRSYANSADAVIVPTATMERRLRAFGVHARIEVLPTGIDVAAFASGVRSELVRSRLGANRGDLLVLSVGRLGREKNVELAIDAFARLGDERARLAIVGDGVHRASLERYAARAGVASRTVFARELVREALPDVYASADAFIFTSASETQGLVLVEALAAGVPVVAVDTPQTREVLDGAGVLAAPSPEAVAAGLARALAGDARDMPARARAARRFDAGLLGNRVIELYEELTLRPVPGGHRQVNALARARD
jgi:glycosyltransferase involved in cell wall biosynthesis